MGEIIVCSRNQGKRKDFHHVILELGRLLPVIISLLFPSAPRRRLISSSCESWRREPGLNMDSAPQEWKVKTRRLVLPASLLLALLASVEPGVARLLLGISTDHGDRKQCHSRKDMHQNERHLGSHHMCTMGRLPTKEYWR